MTAIAIPVFVKSGVDLEDAIASAEEALEGARAIGGGIIELRCDTASSKQMGEAIDAARLPVIVTIRPKWEGGQSEKSDEQRLALWEEAIEAGADYIDVELVAWEKSKKIREGIEEAAEKAGTRVIVSNHSFEGRPKDLEQRIQRLRAVKAAGVLKLAWKAGTILDAVEALRLTREVKREDGRPLVALAMGEEGLISRLLAKKFGAPFTFATVAAGKESAPGQPTAAELLGLYRWGVQKAETPVYGVAGWPVGHSKSPQYHNAGFEKAGFGGVYVPLAIRPEGFEAAVEALRQEVDLRGLSVTIPHKEAAFGYVRARGGEMDAVSRQVGVINTMVWRGGAEGQAEGGAGGSEGGAGGGKGEKVVGMNSDYAGALDALAGAWDGRRESVRGKRVAVLGAGGAARAIVAGLAACGATVVVYNRTRSKADALAAEFGAEGKVVAADWEQLRESCCEAYVNCTPLGMAPQVEGSPIDFDPSWGPETVVFDTVYNPPQTTLLKLAERKGAKTVRGEEMFVRQAAVQLRAFLDGRV